MQFETGSRLAHYEIIGLAGRGGMGEVYRARDLKLDREVAIKVLPEEFTRDPERLVRFDREAHVLAALNHPHIASIYGLEELNGVKFLVMELAAGETLADRLARGPIPIDEATAIAQQIADALEAAHQKGIIHRDLKPANVKIDDDGRVKVLDFGLAKALESEDRAQDVTNSPTLLKASHTGVILGTAAYMSPEQARGKRVDKRTDIWSFGVLLWEMVTAQRPFAGETVTDTLASIITQEPEWSALPANTPEPLRRLLRRCLAKSSHERLHDFADARLEILDALHPSSPTGTKEREAAVPRRPLWMVSAALLLLIIGIAAGALLSRALGPSRGVARIRSTIALPGGMQLAGWASPAVAISPDGSVIALVASRGGKQELYLRRIDEFEAKLVEGSDGAEGPFFSPDGQWVGFGAGAISGRSTAPPALKKASVRGGPSQTICAVDDYFGGSWAEDGFIYFVNVNSEGLWRVAGSGGTRQLLRSSTGMQAHLLTWPQVLPGDEAVLVTAQGESGVLQLASFDLRTGKLDLLPVEAPFARVVRGNLLLFVRSDGVLLAAPFSAKRRAVQGPAVPILSDVALTANGGAVFAVSENGTAVYAQGFVRGSGRELRRPVHLDHDGKVTPLPFDADTISFLSVSPDRTRFAATTWEGDLWLYDLQRSTRMKLPAGNVPVKRGPAWTPDGRAIIFTTEFGTAMRLFMQAADGSDAPRLVLPASRGEYWPGSFTPDGRWLAYYTIGTRPDQNTWETWLLPIANPSAGRKLVAGFNPQISPDGRWLAYESSESGRWEIYLQSFPTLGNKVLVSTAGGRAPAWSLDSRRLFYWSENELMSVDVKDESRLGVGIPSRLFEAKELDMASSRRVAAIAPVEDGFLGLAPVAGSGVQTQLKVALDWLDELEGKLSPEKQ